jgi:hypothetical protein
MRYCQDSSIGGHATGEIPRVPRNLLHVTISPATGRALAFAPIGRHAHTDVGQASLSADQRRALHLLAVSRDGLTDALLISKHDFTPDLLDNTPRKGGGTLAQLAQ